MTDTEIAALRTWYQEALRGRVAQLEALRQGVLVGDAGAITAARGVAHALRGSGGTFGFPGITEAAARVEEDATDAHLARRLEGLAAILRRAAWPDLPRGAERVAWLAAMVGRRPDDWPPDPGDAWAMAAAEMGVGYAELASRVAVRFHVELAPAGDPQRTALNLVPEGLMRERTILPLTEDGRRIHIATWNPTDLETEMELARVSGREPVVEVASPEIIREGLDQALGQSGHLRSSAAGRGGSRGGGSRTCLVVDDDAGARLLVRVALETKGYEVVEAGDGIEALEEARAHPGLALAVVDLQMPRMDGREFLRALRADPELGYLPAIVVTGSEDPRLEADLIEDGADDYIRKPVDPRLFLARVAATLRRASG